MNLDTLLTGIDPVATISNLRVKARKMLLTASLMVLSLYVSAGIGTVVAAIEYFLFYSIIDLNFGAELPTDATPMKVIILSFGSIAAMVGAHVLMLKHPDHPVGRFIRKASSAALLLFFIGMAVLFATTDLGDLTDWDVSLSEKTSLLGQLKDVLGPYFSIVTSLALGGLIFINLAISDAILGYVHRTIPDMREKKATAKRILELSDTFIDLTSKLTQVTKAREQAGAKSLNEQVIEAAAVFEVAITPTLQAFHKLRFLMQSENGSPKSAFMQGGITLPEPLPEPEVLDTYLKDMDTLIDTLPATILSGMAGEFTQPTAKE